MSAWSPQAAEKRTCREVQVESDETLRRIGSMSALASSAEGHRSNRPVESKRRVRASCAQHKVATGNLEHGLRPFPWRMRLRGSPAHATSSISPPDAVNYNSRRISLQLHRGRRDGTPGSAAASPKFERHADEQVRGLGVSTGTDGWRWSPQPEDAPCRVLWS